MLVSCPDCQSMVSDKATACPRCGSPLGAQRTQSREDMLQGVKQRLTEHLAQYAQKPKCPLCGSSMNPISRGAAFAQGNLIGAFTKTHQCVKCGHLA